MREAGESSTGMLSDSDIECARPTGDSHGRTTRGPVQRRGRKVKAALVEDDPVPQYNAANNTSIIKAGAPQDPGPTAGCIDTDLAIRRRNFGQPNKPLIEMAHAYHAM